MLRTPVRRPAYGGYGRVGGGGCRCGGTALLAAVLALLAAVLAVNYVLLERRKCATQLQDLEDVRVAAGRHGRWWAPRR